MPDSNQKTQDISMSPEAQRIAIAEVCGYRHGESKPFWMATPVGQPFVACSVDKLPDYLNDLNAMHEAEKFIPQRDRCLYPGNLIKSTGPDGIIDLVDDYGEWSTSESTSFFALIHATAAQRAEAFLRTLGKWVPDE
jgi:hypothetical protein